MNSDLNQHFAGTFVFSDLRYCDTIGVISILCGIVSDLFHIILCWKYWKALKNVQDLE